MTRKRRPPIPGSEAGQSRRQFLLAAGSLVLGAACSEIEPRELDGTDADLDDGDTLGPPDTADTTGPDASDSADAVEPDTGDVVGADSMEDLEDFEFDLDADASLDDVPQAPVLPGAPFTLGVASGDPAADGFVLWTRLAPSPLDDDGLGGMPALEVPVIWEVALDAELTQIVAAGWAWAVPESAHSVHATVHGLAPDRWYHYRFRVGEAHLSPVARTRTFPRPGDPAASLRLALTTCQSYPQGYYNAHAHLALEPVDAVAFLGDYVYEYAGGGPARSHDAASAITLAQYRRRYALYKLDPDLQACHAALPWITTWDDHEVRNNYAANVYVNPDGSQDDVTERRAAAYQAWYEHQPVRVAAPSLPVSALPIHRRLVFGDLATLHVLDGRQYRSPQACNGEFGELCPEVDDPTRTMLGAAQRDWLVDGLRAAATTWNVVAQQTIFASMTGGGILANVDQWDGYRAERDALAAVFGEAGVRNVLVATGDIHAAALISLHEGGEDVSTRRIGVEVVTTSISSTVDIEGLNSLSETIERFFDHFHHFDASKRGYTVVTVEHGGLRVDFKVVSTVLERGATLTTAESWTVAAETYEVERLRE